MSAQRLWLSLTVTLCTPSWTVLNKRLEPEGPEVLGGGRTKIWQPFRHGRGEKTRESVLYNDETAKTAHWIDGGFLQSTGWIEHILLRGRGKKRRAWPTEGQKKKKWNKGQNLNLWFQLLQKEKKSWECYCSLLFDLLATSEIWLLCEILLEKRWVWIITLTRYKCGSLSVTPSPMRPCAVCLWSWLQSYMHYVISFPIYLFIY